jgi:cell division protein FtsW (lipid II flippase)
LEENPQQFEIIPPQGMTLLLIIAGGGAFFCLIALCVLGAEIRRHMKKR